MKQIKISEKEFEYAIVDWDENLMTEFYQGTEIKSYKRFIFFGKTITEIVPKFLFSVWFNIEDPSYTKLEIREILEKKVALLYRKEEISRGEII